MTKSTVTAFCATEQVDSEHSLTIDGMGEIVLTCTNNLGTEDEPNICGAFFKLPRGSTVAEIKDFLVKYKASSEGQIPTASIEGIANELISGLNDDDGV